MCGKLFRIFQEYLQTCDTPPISPSLRQEVTLLESEPSCKRPFISKTWKHSSSATITSGLLSISTSPCLGTSSNEPLSKSEMEEGTPNPLKLLKTSPVSSQLKNPDYVIYRDELLDKTEQNGGLSKALKDRLVRYTVSNMCTQAYQKPFNRRPTNPEVEEMAKSLTLVYPSIKDVNGSHLGLFYKLRKRLYNTNPSKKQTEVTHVVES